MEGQRQREEKGDIHRRREGGKETEGNIQERGEKMEGERKGKGRGKEIG
jgi:hypothetical protein